MKLKARIFDIFIPCSWLYVRRKDQAKTLYLTFDDGPEPAVTPILLELLDKHNIKATFFCIGEKMDAYPELTQQIASNKHTLANHTYNHRKFDKLDLAAQLNEINQTNTLIANATGQTTSPLFRTPHGKWQPKLLLALIKKKIPLALWSLDSLDYFYTNPVDICQRFENIKPTSGDIILFHDDSLTSVYALETLIPKWKEMGFEMKAL